ncbi:hypothetical protein [Klebsiella variicola]|uniref:hypothetical protein n=1 Tax=Klebsiella variicola TaxID=244366 RepID=UPI00073C11CE|nr:hypothetical protein [Klebsiella variicola]KSZ28011.1 hypothetical protein APU20_01975 [Klebsiella variicola]HBW2749354.1 hypothetical protein [Klebsiella variicola]HCA8920229.1 hypothetical protein [Klebsiella variicola]HCA9064528.1 hypothetical protein [Klebsiella variicola]HCA9075390.1 hypothetical protein [Klebsiella variicola]
MSVTIRRELEKQITYPGLRLTVPGGAESVDVTYTATGISNFDGTNVTALFSVAIGNEKSPFDYSFTFQYSGSGNPLDEAEPALKVALGE